MTMQLQPSACEVAKMFAKECSVLLVEDDPLVAGYMRRILSRFDVCVEHAQDRATLEVALDSRYDLVILDLVVPDISRMDLLRMVADRTSCPVMVMSGNIDTQIQQAAISILDRPIWFVDKPASFGPESFDRVFRMFNLSVGAHR
jgi:DNA-binding NtrC family response regulator